MPMILPYHRHLVFALRFLTMTSNNNFELKIIQHTFHRIYSAQTEVVCLFVCPDVRMFVWLSVSSSKNVFLFVCNSCISR